MFDDKVLDCFVKDQLKLFPKEVVANRSEAADFLEECMATVVKGKNEVIEYFEEEGLRETVAVPKLPREEHDGCIDAMLKALREGTPLDTECFENIHTLEMVFACLTSAGEGRKVWIGEAT